MKFNRFGNMMPLPEEKKKPYLLYEEPFRIAGNLYFVGNRWCSSHLIDTGEGLILLDTPCASAVSGLIDAIYRLGFQLRDLKYIVVSHAHPDHYGAVNALVHLTGAKTFLGEVDARDMRENPERLEGMNKNLDPFNESFVPDVELADGDVVELGNTRMRCVWTPGHTVGVMSHFWELEDEGVTRKVGIYGGAGFASLSPERLRKNGLPMSLRDQFLESIDKVWEEPVDIMLGNHPFHNDTYPKRQRVLRGEKDAFVDPGEWHRFLQELKDLFLAFREMPQEEIDKIYSVSQWEMYYGEGKQ